MASTFRVSINGASDVLKMFNRYRSAGVRNELHTRWGIQTLRWVDKNFRLEGALTGTPWAELKQSTSQGRRRGGGLGGPRILQDSGKLKQSFHYQRFPGGVVVGSPQFYAAYHEEGRRGPWRIPRSGFKTLRWRTAGGFQYRTWTMHPGLPQRRMLPRKTDKNYMAQLRTTAINLLNQIKRGKRF